MQLSTSTYGDGPRRVGLVHGLGGSGELWTPLIDVMLASGTYTITTVDLRGHGTSERAPDYTLDALAADVVESLPAGLDSVVGHSLGGAVLARAVDRLAPGHAVYLDPGFQMAMPTTGLRGRLFWLAPKVSLVLAQLRRLRGQKPAEYPAETRALIETATSQFDQGMMVPVFRDVAFHPVAAGRPAVPSTLVLSDDSPTVLREETVRSYEQSGWDVRRLRGIQHDMHLDDAQRVYDTIADVL